MGAFFSALFGGGRPTPSPAPAPPAPAPGVAGTVVPGLQPSCSQTDLNTFNICLDIDPSIRGNRLQFYEGARDRWQGLVTGQVQEFESRILPFTPVTALPEIIDDIYIGVREFFLDGPGGTLGQAGPEFVNQDDFPIVSIIEFDAADVDIEIRAGSFLSTATHEMAHCLGVGTLWIDKGVVSGNTYVGPQVNQEWANIGCVDQIPIDVEAGHWGEDCLQTELMTPVGLVGEVSIVSRITVASLQDLGYQVNLNGADSFTTANINQDVCCFANRRNLREGSLPFDMASDLDGLAFSRVDDDVRDNAAKYAAQKMRAKRENAPTDLPDGIRYVGGDVMTVFVKDSDGKTKDLTFRWEQVMHL